VSERLCGECLGVVESSWDFCPHCSSLLAAEPAPETPRTTGPKGPPPARITETSPEDSQDEKGSTDTQFSEDAETEDDQITTQSEDSFEEFGIFEPPSSESDAESGLEEVGKRSKRRLVGLVLTPILVIGVAFLIVSSTVIPPGTISLLDEYRDSDGDGFNDKSDVFPLDSTEWADADDDGIGNNGDADDDGDGYSDADEVTNCGESNDPLNPADRPLDSDNDGNCNALDTDDDGDGWLDTEEVACGTSPVSSNDQPSDTDNDGNCNALDTDDDGDGFSDYIDLFPLDSSEWSDFDNDGIGDNADLDDDNDLVPDSVDSNDYADTGFILTFDTIQINEQMDYFDSYGEIYICLHWNYDYLESWTPMDYIYSCTPNDRYWTLEDYTTYDISAYSVFIDLPEQHGSHTFGLSVWDSDSWEDDPVDINPSSDYNFYYFQYLSQSTNQISFSADGAGDGQGWDGVLTFSIQPIDVRLQGNRQFTWVYDELTWSYETALSYSTYTAFRNLDHSVRGINYIEDYARFSTPNEQYVIDLATDLENMAIQNGYTTELEIAEFIYAFVGAIEYQFDIEGMGQNDYPKYSIEMLWHQSGDCEDAAALYISLVEAIGFDAMLMVGLVKINSEEDWGGHAWAVIYIPGHSGEGWYGIGSKSSLPFYFVETTDYYDGSSEIGRNPWYDVTDYSMYDVE